MKTTHESYWDIEDCNLSSVPESNELARSFKENDTETAVFHPYDPSTDFLYEIYQGKRWNVIFWNVLVSPEEQYQNDDH